jgi:hypothetical protein
VTATVLVELSRDGAFRLSSKSSRLPDKPITVGLRFGGELKPLFYSARFAAISITLAEKKKSDKTLDERKPPRQRAANFNYEYDTVQ